MNDAAFDHPSTETLPPRVRALRDDLVRLIPCVPEAPDVRAQLRAMPLPGLMHEYVHWAARFVPARQRTVMVALDFWDQRAKDHRSALDEIVGAIRRGDELRPYLSDHIESMGYAPFRLKANGRRSGAGGPARDFALNAYGVHHLHLSSKGSEQLLYVVFDRVTATLIMVGDHKSFDDGSLEAAVTRHKAAIGDRLYGVTPDSDVGPLHRTKLARRGVNMAANVNGVAVQSSMLMASGHSFRFLHYADYLCIQLQHFDPMLDDPTFVADLEAQVGSEFVDAAWHLQDLDLCVLNRARDRAALLVPGLH